MLLLALLTGAPAAGCGASDGSGGATEGRGSATAASPSASATPPEVLCARIVAYWSRETLKGDTYGDYQSMGLSDGQYEILRGVVEGARAERAKGRPEAAERLIDREARAGCERWYRDGGPDKGPWR